jgi:putative peptidoglycan lipid II flippase
VTDDIGAVELAGGPPEVLPGRPMAATIARAGIVVSAAYLVSRLLGYVRFVVIGATFGLSPDLDSFLTAFRIPDLIFQLVAAGAVASALVPLVSGFIATGDAPRAWRIVSTVANLMLLGLALLAVVAFILAPAIIPIIAPGFDAAEQARTVDLTRVMVIGPILLGLGAVATAGLNGSRRFAASAIAPISYNLAIIGAAVILAPTMGVAGLAIGVVVGSAGHLLIQLPPLVRAGYRWIPKIDLSDAEARHAFVLMAPRAVGLGATQLIFVTLTSLASSVGTGAISAYTLAFSLLQIPIGVIGIPLGIVLFPSLAGELALGRTGTYLALIGRALRVLVFVMLPLAALGMVLRTQVVELLLGYGKFTAADVDLTAATLLLFLIGLPAHGIIDILARSFYARRDTATPVVAAILSVVVTIALAVALIGPMQLPAVGLALSVGTWVEAMFLFVALRRLEAGLDVMDLGWVALRSLIAALLAAAAAIAVLAALAAIGVGGPGGTGGGKVAALVEAVAATLVGGAIYLGTAALFGIPELETILSTGRALLPGRHAPG